MRRAPMRTAPLSLAFAALLLFSGSAVRAQCPDVQDHQPLRRIPELSAPGAKELSTTFDVQIKPQCVPTTTVVKTETGSDGQTITTYEAQELNLRTYVYPDPQTGQPAWGFPGPTLRLRKADDQGQGGQGLAILLKNSLPAGSETCNSACAAGTVCDPSTLPQLLKDCAVNAKGPNCCCVIDLTQEAPNCFHGDNTTNLHFHGTHASPQPPQDFVLLELKPSAAQAAADSQTAHDAHGAHGASSVIAYGEYQYRVDPFRRTQPEGSHWYHPHKHGSVSLQVANGMPGALIIEGPFDDWLRGFYGGQLEEQLLVLQQIEQGTNLFGQGGAPQILVNGQINPSVTMEPGEVQRWRFVNATMQAGAQLNVYFPAGAVVRQFAMDGVRFSPLSYQCQPLYNPNPLAPCNMKPVTTPSITLSPGNRADFLVQAPLAEGLLRVERKIIGNVGDEKRDRLEALEERLAPGPEEPTLFTLRVDDGKEGRLEATTFQVTAANMPTPAQWPVMPDYLRNIESSEIVPPSVDLVFQQTAVGSDQPGAQGSPLTQFKINGLQYQPGCVNVTTQLDRAKEWLVSNVTRLQHPFHIHTNPFQVVSNGTVTYPDPIWQDTIGLPKGSDAAPGSVLLRQRYEEFTGEYVLHCHFLGHEDRGMMFGVQTVCTDNPDKFGTPNAGGTPECTPATLKPATPQCSTVTSASASAAGGE